MVKEQLYFGDGEACLLGQADGYGFQFPNEPGMFMQIATFVEHERQCCPFYSFALEAEPSNGPFRLRMTGGEGVKEFMEVVWSDVGLNN